MANAELRWAKMPCTWQTSREKHDAIRGRGLGLLFRATDHGVAIAALKLYITLCLKANFKANARFSCAGCVQKSITDLEGLTDLSRPMVIGGLRKLAETGIIQIQDGRPRVYCIVGYETSKYWGKLPSTYLFDDREKQVKMLFTLQNRSRTTLAALQLYLYVAAVQDRSGGGAKVTYDTLSDRTGLSRSEISDAISLLVGSELVSVRQNEDGGPQKACNIYWLRGLAKHRPEGHTASDPHRISPLLEFVPD